MYKDVVKKVIAWVLVLCMIGGIPDVSLWATEISARSSDGGGNHTYALENKVELRNGEIIDTHQPQVTITNTFKMDGTHDNSGLYAQRLTSVFFALNKSMNSLGDTGRYIETAHYAVEVSGENGNSIDKEGEYQATTVGGFTVDFDPGNTVQFGAGEKVTVKLTISNAQWAADSGSTEEIRDVQGTVSFCIADRNGNEGTSECGGYFDGNQKAAVIRLNTVEETSSTPTTGIAFKADTPTSVLVNESKRLELDFTPPTASERDVTWTSSDESIATVGSDGTVRGLAPGRVTITASLNSGSASPATTTINVCKDMSSSDITCTIGNQNFTGQALTPSVAVYDGTKQLGPNLHYTYTWENNVHAGTGTMIIRGVESEGYSGTKRVDFTIDPASLGAAAVNVDIKSGFSYVFPTEEEIEQYKTDTGNDSATGADVLLSKIKEDLKKGYTVATDSDTSNDGDYNIQITFKPSAATGAFVNYLNPDTDYSISGYELSTGGRGAYIEITGTAGDYKDTRKIDIPIKKSVTAPGIRVEYTDTAIYTGENIEPEVKVYDGNTLLTEDDDYTVAYYDKDSSGANQTLTADAGEKCIVITGEGIYASDDGSGNPITIERKYTVHPRNINSNDVKVELPNQINTPLDETNLDITITYNGVPLVKDTDFTLKVTSPSGSDSAYTVEITGKGNYTGTRRENTKIGIDISDQTKVKFRFVTDVTTDGGINYMGGNEVKPKVELVRVLPDGTTGTALVENQHYKLTYTDNVNAGTTAKVKITGMGDYAGAFEKTFTIKTVALNDEDKLEYSWQQVLPFNVKMTSGSLDTKVESKISKIEYTYKDIDGRTRTASLKANDYTATCQNNTGIGMATIAIAPGTSGNFTGSHSLQYTISPRNVSVASVENGGVLDITYKTPTYTGEALKAEDVELCVKHNNIDLAQVDPTFFNDNFTVTIREQGNGTVKINVVGKKNYTGSWEKTVDINPYDIGKGNVTVSNINPQEYVQDKDIELPAADEPTVTLALPSGGTKTLVKGTDYTLSYSNNKEVGDAVVTVTGINNFTGTKTKPFVIYKNLDDDATLVPYKDTIQARDIPQQNYTGSAITLKPEDVVLYDILKTGARTTVSSDRYKVNYLTTEDYTSVRNGVKIEVEGTGTYYRGKRTLTFDIVPNTMANVTVNFVDDPNPIYDGSPKKPRVEVTCGTKTLLEDTDYTLDYLGDIINAGDRDSGANAPRVLVTGIGNFAGASVTGNAKIMYYTIHPKVLTRIPDPQTNISYVKPPAEIEVGEDGRYRHGVRVTDPDWKLWNGTTATTTPRRLVEGYDYTVTCKATGGADGTDGLLTITGIGNYGGKLEYDVKLQKRPLSDDDVTVEFLGGREFVYTGESVAKQPSFGLTIKKKDGTVLKQDVDYTVVAAPGGTESDLINYTNATKKFAVQIHSDELSGELEKDNFTFRIKKKGIDASDVHVSIPNLEYDGTTLIQPTVTVTYNGMTLANGTDYTYRVENYDASTINNPNIRPQVVITAVGNGDPNHIGNYDGTRTVTFGVGSSIAGATVTLSSTGYTLNEKGYYIYPGGPTEPIPTVVLGGSTLVKDRDYTVSYENNENMTELKDDQPTGAVPTVIITGTGKYAGTATKTFIISRKNIADNEGGRVDIPTSVEVEFTGSQVKPDLNIVYHPTGRAAYTLVPGTDYTISDNNLVNVGANQRLEVTFPTSSNFYNRSTTTSGSVSKIEVNCTVTPKSFKDVNSETDPGDISVVFTDLQDEYEYTGSPVTPAITVKDIKRNADGSYREDGDKSGLSTAYTLTTDDYTVEYKGNNSPGTATVTVKGKGNYKTQSITREFNIKGDMGYATVEFLDDKNQVISNAEFPYTGRPIRPKVRVFFGDDRDHPLVEGRNAYDPNGEFYCTYVGDNGDEADVVSRGTKSVIIHGINKYAGSADLKKDYTIIARDINDATVETLGSFSYTGAEIHPVPKLYYDGVLLEAGTDYTCEYRGGCIEPNETADTLPYYVIIRAVEGGNFTGTYKNEPEFRIGNSFKEDRILIRFKDGNSPSYEYTGRTIKPELYVYDQMYQQELIEGTDYEVAIEEGDPTYINAGEKTVRVYGKNGSHPYIGDITKTFTITPVDLAGNSILIDREGILNDTNTRYQYYGDKHWPEPTVYWRGGGRELSKGYGEFVYDYGENIHATVGTSYKATVTVKEGAVQSGGTVPNFTGSVTKEFIIHPVELDEDHPWLQIEDPQDWEYVFTGQEVIPDPVIRYNGMLLNKDGDYRITSGYTGVTDSARATIQFIGDYSGTITKPFVIRKRRLTDQGVNISLSGGNSYKYTGQAIRPEVLITYGSTQLTQGVDFSLEYGENKNAGEGTVTITGINNYEGTVPMRFTIAKIDITSGDVEVEIDDGVIKNGQPAEPEFTVYWVQDGTRLRVYSDRDTEAESSGREIAYSYDYFDNTAVGQTGRLVLTGKNNFEGVRTVTFDIGSDINDFIEPITWKNGTPNLTFNNQKQEPEITVNVKPGENLVKDKDYKIVYEPVSDNGDGDITNAGEYKVYVKGLKPYAGRSNELTFTIAQRNISNVTFTVPDAEFTGSEIKPSITAEDTQIGVTLVDASASANRAENVNAYTTTITGNTVNAGRVSVAISAVGTGNYYGSVTKDFNITPKNLVGSSVTISPNMIEDQIYTGNPIMPKITIVDTARNASGAAVTAGTGNYELTSGDYTITYTDNVYPGKATVTIAGRGNYQNRLAKEFTINADLSMAEVAPIPVQAYTGAAVTPALTVTLAGKTLVVNRDYTVTYQNNVNRGIATATITATPLGGYTGEKTVTFEIGRDLASAQVRAVADAFTYTGSPITPQIAVVFGSDTLRPGIDYTATFANNVNVGTATVTVTGQGVYSGTIVRTFEIVAKNVARCSFGSVETRQYNGQATSQNLMVTDGGRALVLNQDYSITYVNNTNPGTATIQIAGLGNYGGVKTIRYNIEVKPMTNISASKVTKNSVKLSWSPVDHAEGYAIYNGSNRLVAKTQSTSYTVKKLSSMKSYKYRVRPYKISDGATYYGDFSNTVSVVTLPSTPGSVKVKAGSRQAKISWKKVSGVTGYEVYRSTKKSSGYKRVTTIKKASTTSYTNKKLSSKRKYYFKVRAYKTVNGKKLYSAYSSPKQVKVK